MSSVINPKIKSTPSDLEGYRNQIDLIDQQLVRLLEQRAQIVFAVGQYKRENNLPAHAGVITPASAMGDALVPRLRRAGMTLNVI